MESLIEQNNDIINSLREMYIQCPRHELRDVIARHFIPTVDEMEINAEVPTPPFLIDEMLATIPSTFWETPKTVYEPCCGKGNIVLAIYEKFFEGLADYEPDEAKRTKLILTKCIHYSDLNEFNVLITTLILSCFDRSCQLNNYTVGDTLSMPLNQISYERFDAVVGNPPYQTPSNNKKRSSSLWPSFIKTMIEDFIKPGGYLLFINPPMWRKPNPSCVKVKNLMMSKRILNLRMFHKTCCKTHLFNKTIHVDYYLIQNSPCDDTLTKVTFMDRTQANICLSKYPYIPNFGWPIFEKIFSIHNDPVHKHLSIEAHGSSTHTTSKRCVSCKQSTEFHYKIFNSSNSESKTWRYSNTEPDIAHVPKVLFSNGEIIYPFYDPGGIGITQGGIYISAPSEDYANRLIEFLNSPLVSFIIKATKWSLYETDKLIFKYLRLIDYELTDVEKSIINTHTPATLKELDNSL